MGPAAAPVPWERAEPLSCPVLPWGWASGPTSHWPHLWLGQPQFAPVRGMQDQQGHCRGRKGRSLLKAKAQLCRNLQPGREIPRPSRLAIHRHTYTHTSHVNTDHTCTPITRAHTTHTRPSPHPHVTCSHTSQGAHHMYTPITHACTRYACTRGGDTVGTPAPGCSQGLCHAHRDATTMEKPLTQGRGPVRAERHGPHLPFALPLAHTTPECHPDSCSAPHSPSGQAGAHRTSWLQGGPWESGKHGPHFWPRAPGAGGVGARWRWGTGSH